MAATRHSFSTNPITVAPTTPFNYPINKPAPLSDGDVVYLFLCSNGSAGTITPPAGFSLLGSNITQNPRLYAFRKVITNAAGEPATWNIVGTAGVTAATAAVAVIGADNTTPEDAATVFTANAAALSAALTGLTTVTDGAYILDAIGINSSTAAITETSALVAEVAEIGGKKLEIDDGTKSPAGATGTITYNIASSLASTGCVIAVRPAGAAAPAAVGAASKVLADDAATPYGLGRVMV